MSVLIREALDTDKSAFVEFALSLCKFNRSNHNEQSKYDDFDKRSGAWEKAYG